MVSRDKLYQLILCILYLWVLLEGILRKWFLPSLSHHLFFVKYIVIGILITTILISRIKISAKDFPFWGFYLFFMFYCLLQIANLNISQNLIIPTAGLLLYFAFSVTAFFIPHCIKTEQTFILLLRLLFLISLPIFVLGIVQYFSPPDSFINKYAIEMDTVAVVGDHARITTIFSYLGTNNAFLKFSILVLFGYVLQLQNVNIKSLIFISTFLLGIINAFMTGSRGAVLTILILIILIIAGSAWLIQGKQYKMLLIKFLIFVALGGVVLGYNAAGKEAVDSFSERVTSNDDFSGRVSDAFSPFKFYEQAGLIGLGIGTTYQGISRYIDKRYLMPHFWEEESERIVLEVGAIGFILYLILRLSILIYCFLIVKRIKENSLKLYAYIFWVMQIPTVLFVDQVTFNWMSNLLYWTSIGLIVTVSNIDKIKQAQSTSIAAG